jgi:hypothetical protein
VSSFKASMTLNDDRFLDVVPEPWWGGPSAVMMTLLPSVILVFNVGRYLDTVIETPQGLRFADKRVAFDSELIANSLIYPL